MAFDFLQAEDVAIEFHRAFEVVDPVTRMQKLPSQTHGRSLARLPPWASRFSSGISRCARRGATLVSGDILMKRALPGKKRKKATPARKPVAQRPTLRKKSPPVKATAKKAAPAKKTKAKATKPKV